MMEPKVIALLLAPLLGGLIWWALLTPGRMAYRYLWKRLPSGKLRDFLIKERKF